MSEQTKNDTTPSQEEVNKMGSLIKTIVVSSRAAIDEAFPLILTDMSDAGIEKIADAIRLRLSAMKTLSFYFETEIKSLEKKFKLEGFEKKTHVYELEVDNDLVKITKAKNIPDDIEFPDDLNIQK